MSLLIIEDLKKTKPTAQGAPRWRFSTCVDLTGHTVGVTGWIYLPEAKPGYRVWPPRRGVFKTVKGVTREVTRNLETLVEEKLRRQAVTAAEEPTTPDEEFTEEEQQEYQNALLSGSL